VSSLRRIAARWVSEATGRSGLLELIRATRRRRGDYRVFILEYHDLVSRGNEPEGTVTKERFHRHLRFLKDRCRLVTLSEAVDRLREATPLAEDLAVITFDDGTHGNYETAWPVLKEEEIRATIFATTGFLDGAELWFDLARRCLEAARGIQLPKPMVGELAAVLGRDWTTGDPEAAVERLKVLPPEERDAFLARFRAACPLLPPPRVPLTWDQVREMHAAGIEIGCHTVSHPILSTLPPVRQEEEITRARLRIAEEIGEAPTLFAYPNGAAGDYDDATQSILRRTGFAAACTTLRGSNRPGCDLYQLKRIGVGADSEYFLDARLAGLFDEGVRAYLPGAP